MPRPDRRIWSLGRRPAGASTLLRQERAAGQRRARRYALVAGYVCLDSGVLSSHKLLSGASFSRGGSRRSEAASRREDLILRLVEGEQRVDVAGARVA